MNVKHGNDCDNNSCQLCDYKSHDKAFLRTHMTFKHYKEVSNETFCCNVCDEDINKKNLIKHIKEQHTEKSSNQCPECDKQF